MTVKIVQFDGYSAGACLFFPRFESCWPAIARDTNGVVFVFNPDQPNHDKELESW